MKTRLMRWSLMLLLTIAGIAGSYFAFLRPTSPAVFQSLEPSSPTPMPLRDRIGRWIPVSPSWAWAWRVEQAVFGKRKPANFSFQILRLASSRLPDSCVPLGATGFADTNGTQAWLVEADLLKSLQQDLNQEPGTKILMKPRISTADGIAAELFQGELAVLNGTTNQVGLVLQCYARVNSRATDLRLHITHSHLATNPPAGAAATETATVVKVVTNLYTGLRVQIPKGQGVFLLNTSARNERDGRLGVILAPPQM